MVSGVLGVVIGANFSDPGNSRVIYATAAVLAMAGLALLFGTVRWWRRSRSEHPALGPLEVMGDRSWWKAPLWEREKLVGAVRLTEPAAAVEAQEEVDLRALVKSTPASFDDLRDGAAGSGSTVEPVEQHEPVELEHVNGAVVAEPGVEGSDEPASADADVTSFAESPEPVPAMIDPLLALQRDD